MTRTRALQCLPVVVAFAAAGILASPMAALAADACGDAGVLGSEPTGLTDSAVNTYVGGDFLAAGSAAEVEGVLVVEGSAVFDKANGGRFNVGVVGVGAQVPPPPGSDMLVVGGDVRVGSSTILDVGAIISPAQDRGGNVVAGGTVDPLSRVEVSGAEITQAATSPTSPYQATPAALERLSAAYRAMPTTGTVAAGQFLEFRGDGVSMTQVFSVAGDALVGASPRFLDIPAGGAVIVNVLGDTVRVDTRGFFSAAGTPIAPGADPLFGALASHTLWNFADASRLDFAGSDQFLGSVLASRQGVEVTSSAHLNGRILVAGDLTMSGVGQEIHSFPFVGADELVCNPTSEPQPETVPGGEETPDPDPAPESKPDPAQEPEPATSNLPGPRDPGAGDGRADQVAAQPTAPTSSVAADLASTGVAFSIPAALAALTAALGAFAIGFTRHRAAAERGRREVWGSAPMGERRAALQLQG